VGLAKQEVFVLVYIADYKGFRLIVIILKKNLLLWGKYIYWGCFSTPWLEVPGMKLLIIITILGYS